MCITNWKRKIQQKQKKKLFICWTRNISWLGTEYDLRKLFDYIKALLKQRFDHYNAHVESELKLAWDSALDVIRRHLNIFKQYIFNNLFYIV